MIIWQLDSNTHSAAGTWCIKKHHKPERSIARRCPLAPWLSAAIEQAGITPTLRPEQLTVADFQHISRFGASLLDNPLKN